jgi:P-type conjugative transfer protein TrbJ
MNRILTALRRRAAPLAMAVTAALAAPQPTAAIYCANCGTEWTQIANNLELVAQLEQQVAMVQQQIAHYRLLLTNTNPLASQVWSNALGEIRQLTGILGRAKSLSFATGDLAGQFARKFRDYNQYVADRIGDDALNTKFQQWSEDTNSSVLTSLEAAGLQQEQIEGVEDSYLRHLEGEATTAEGQMQALQVGNQIAIALARQMQKLRTLIATNMQMQANYIQQQMDRDAAQGAAWRNFAKKPQISITDGEKY